MMLVNKGLALVVSADKPIYFVDTPSFSQISQGSVIGYILPSVPIPNGVLILFVLVTWNRSSPHYRRALGVFKGERLWRMQVGEVGRSHRWC
jgi:hypothetical protein